MTPTRSEGGSTSKGNGGNGRDKIYSIKGDYNNTIHVINPTCK